MVDIHIQPLAEVAVTRVVIRRFQSLKAKVFKKIHADSVKGESQAGSPVYNHATNLGMVGKGH